MVIYNVKVFYQYVLRWCYQPASYQVNMDADSLLPPGSTRTYLHHP